jgi:hypothetical protein
VQLELVSISSPHSFSSSDIAARAHSFASRACSTFRVLVSRIILETVAQSTTLCFRFPLLFCKILEDLN